MRIWTLHPRCLDQKGLVALWREGLLAQKVLMGLTKGYVNHPQLLRFRAHAKPLAMLSAYLHGVCDEARSRSYRFDCAKIMATPWGGRVEESEGQLRYEWAHLLNKLEKRDPSRYEEYYYIRHPKAHPLFRIVPGDKKEWERG